jgi:hypothetical protein
VYGWLPSMESQSCGLAFRTPASTAWPVFRQRVTAFGGKPRRPEVDRAPAHAKATGDFTPRQLVVEHENDSAAPHGALGCRPAAHPSLQERALLRGRIPSLRPAAARFSHLPSRVSCEEWPPV